MLEKRRRSRPAELDGDRKSRLPFCLAPFSEEKGFPGDTTRRCKKGLDAPRLDMVYMKLDKVQVFKYIDNVVHQDPAHLAHPITFKMQLNNQNTLLFHESSPSEESDSTNSTLQALEL